MASKRIKSSSEGWADWVAVVAMVATAMAPVPVISQPAEGGGESGSAEEANESSGEAEASGEVPTMYLLPVDRVQESISGIVPDRIDELTRGGIESDKRMALKSSLGTGAEEAAGDKAVSEARGKYRSGIGLVEAGEYERASETLSEAVSSLRDNIEHLEDFPVLVDALKNLARAYGEAGFDFDARATMREFAHLNPDATLDPKKFSEKLRKIYAEEAKKVRSAGTGQLTIEATKQGENVEGAQVVIDGTNKGTTPVEVTDVGFGYHYLVIRGPAGETVATKQMQVRGRDSEQTFTLELAGGSKEAEDGQADGDAENEETPAFYSDLRETIQTGRFKFSELKPYLDEVGNRTGADVVTWVLMSRDDSGYQATPFAYRVEDGRFVQGETVEFDVQLSNLRSGSSTLAEEVVATALQIDEYETKQRVALVEKPASAGEVTSEAAGESKASASGQTGEPTSSETKQAGEAVEPPPTPEQSAAGDDDRGISPWWYVAGSAVVVGGLAAGGAVLLSNPSDPTRPTGFEAQVSW